MSKSSREGLFGITLTELVIILFFIMLLLAIFNIEKINEELVETQKLVPESSEDIISKSTIIEILFPDGEITSDLISFKEIEDKIAELQQTQNEYQKLTKETAEQTAEGSGDCAEGGAWTDPKCADYCWEIDSTQTNRKYDYLVDIGICRSSVVVQRSEWAQKSELDFLFVDGSLEMVNKSTMKPSELYGYLDLIKEPGYKREPKQCAHYVRVVDLGAGSISRWVSVNKEISTRVGRYELTDRDGDYYEIVKSRFPENICDDIQFEQSAEVAELNSLSPSQTSTTLDLINVDKVQKDPKLYFDSFQTAFNQECSRSTRQIRNNEKITLKYEISLTSDGEVLLVESLSENDLVNSNLRRLDTMAKKSLKKSKFEPKYIDGIPWASTYKQSIPFGKNACM
tara:strand:+ start:1429 stop:2622 length:1194 start_codon:yes stop_codon:yes gene_type:complete